MNLLRNAFLCSTAVGALLATPAMAADPIKIGVGGYYLFYAVAGHIDGTVDNPPLVLPHIKAGTLTALAVASTKRLPVLPDVPTAAEAGLPNWEVSSWFGVATI